MHNILQNALCEHLDQNTNDPKKLNEYYQTFKDSEERTAEALAIYADLVFDYGVDKDSTLSKIDAPVVMGIGMVLRSLANDLSLAQYGHEYTSMALDRLTQGGNNEN
ncbi:hypothetical protein [Necropsobacter massiliensis]|uniref:hypothetical protein n=1 Tax=Necropsobacter massiliensis TaxID=1400001 RepID=UPI00059637EA|nr:hypothetical protein [Necropsobacter massiliensis]